MNILFINNYNCSPDISGGVNRVIYALTRRFTEDLGYNCFFGYFNDIPSDKRLAEFAGRIKLQSPLNENEFKQFLCENRIDIVEVNFLRKENLFTLASMYKVTKELGIKLVYELHMYPGFEVETYGTFERVMFSISHHGNTKLELYRWFISLFKPVVRPFSDLLVRKKYRLPYDNCDKVVLLSQYYLDDYCRIAGLKKTKEVVDKFTAIGNGLPFNQIINDEDILKKEKNVVVVQRFDDFAKRISLVLKIWKKIEQNNQLNDWTLTLVGDGEFMNYYRYLEKKLNLKRVTFTGLQYPVEYYRKASIFLMTSCLEGWPMVMMEASQMGVPVLAFNAFGALKDIIQDHYNGILIPNNDMDAFYHCLANLMLDEDRLQKMQFNAKEASQNFTIDKFIEKWKNLFEEMKNNSTK